MNLIYKASRVHKKAEFPSNGLFSVLYSISGFCTRNLKCRNIAAMYCFMKTGKTTLTYLNSQKLHAYYRAFRLPKDCYPTTDDRPQSEAKICFRGKIRMFSHFTNLSTQCISAIDF